MTKWSCQVNLVQCWTVRIPGSKQPGERGFPIDGCGHPICCANNLHIDEWERTFLFFFTCKTQGRMETVQTFIEPVTERFVGKMRKDIIDKPGIHICPWFPTDLPFVETYKDVGKGRSQRGAHCNTIGTAIHIVVKGKLDTRRSELHQFPKRFFLQCYHLRFNPVIPKQRVSTNVNHLSQGNLCGKLTTSKEHM